MLTALHSETLINNEEHTTVQQKIDNGMRGKNI